MESRETGSVTMSGIQAVKIRWSEFRGKGHAGLEIRSGLDARRSMTLRKYRLSSRVLLGGAVYPVWFTSPDRSEIRDYLEPGATPILFRELATLPGLRAEKLQEYEGVPWTRGEFAVPLEHCSACDRRIVKDGCHRLLQVAAFGEDCPITVLEASAGDWSHSRYDMKLVCKCLVG